MTWDDVDAIVAILAEWAEVADAESELHALDTIAPAGGRCEPTT